MANSKQPLSISVLQSVLDKADYAVAEYKEDYPNRSRFFEVAGIELYKRLKAKERRQEK